MSLPWTLVGKAPPETRSLTIRFLSGGCEPFDHVQVQQTSRAISIAVVGRQRSGCADYGRVNTRRVVLAAPLAGRSLVHATSVPAASGGADGVG